jgi:vancomycin permeability regulator SanA
LQIREKLACIKAFFEVYINRKPKFLGDEIPITGDSHKSFDQ